MICILIIALYPVVVISERCLASSHILVENAPYCPRNESELFTAIQRKKCEIRGIIQNCTRPEQLKYHCLSNVWRNTTIEVCAPVIISQGYCLEFNESSGRLQENYRMDCTHFSKPCSTLFESSDVLHYMQCNDIITVSLSTESNQTLTNAKNNYERLFLILTILLTVIVSVVVGFMCYSLKGRYLTERTKRITLNSQETLISKTEVTVLQGTRCERLEECQELYSRLRERLVDCAVVVENSQPESTNHLIHEVDKSGSSAQVHVSDRQVVNNLNLELQAYSFEVFEKIMKKYSIKCKKNLADQGIDCLATFCTMTESDFKKIGLTTGDSRKCAIVAKLITEHDLSHIRTV